MKFNRKTWTVAGVTAAMLLVPAGVSFAVAEATVSAHAAAHAPDAPGANRPGMLGARLHDRGGQGPNADVRRGLDGRQGRLGGQQGTAPGAGPRGGQAGVPGANQPPVPTPSTPSAN